MTQSQVVAASGKNITVNVSRAFSELRSVFATMWAPTFNENMAQWMKPWNFFYHPMARVDYHTTKGELEYQLSIGSKVYPTFPIRSCTETYYQLTKCLGIHGSGVHSIDVDADEFNYYKHVLGIDLERYLQVPYTGVSTQSGSLMSLKIRSYDVNSHDDVVTSIPSTGSLCDTVYITCHYQAAIVISSTGVELYE